MSITFQYYPAKVKSNEPLGVVTLDQFIEGHKSPSKKKRAIFTLIEDAEASGNDQLKSELKQNNLYYFTPCVYVNKWRRYNNIIRFTGLLVLDFDHLKSIEYSIRFKEFLFNEYQCIIACWLSPSKYGVKALVNIPIVETVKQFKEYFFGIAAEVSQYEGFDGTCQNSVLPLFQSYDPDMLVRDDYNKWTTTGYKVNSFDDVQPTQPPDIDISDKDRETIVKIIHTGFEGIPGPDGGHPALRALCTAVGGYVASGYIGEYDAIQLIDYLIQGHHYLSKGIAGYKKTAHWGIQKGQIKPLILSRYE